jgi:hypothetical protein
VRQKISDKKHIIKVKEVEITSENGSRTTIDMMLDTRSLNSAILPSVAKRLGYDAGGGFLGIISGKSRHIKTTSVSVRGKSHVYDLPFAIFENDKLSELGVEGLLGLDFIGEFRLVVDYKTGYIELTT